MITSNLSATIALASQLIACPSITPDEAGTFSILIQRLEALGFICERLDHNKVSNLWAYRGSAKPLFCFAGHVDVVPPGAPEKWRTAPFEPTIQNGMLYGRGAADMKSSIAAFITALERFIVHHADHNGSIALLITSDEEGIAVDGTAYVVKKLAERNQYIDYCIVGEPSSVNTLGDTIKNGRRGSLSGTLTIHGQQGHVAYPHLANNPIHSFAPAMTDLITTCWDHGNEFFPPTTFQISNIHSGTGSNNVIPGECKVLFNFRFSPVSNQMDLRTRAHTILDRHHLDYTIEWHLSGDPFLTDRGPLVNAIEKAVNDTVGMVPVLSTDGGTSDGRFIANICPQIAELGPINATIHQTNECVSIESIDLLSAIYEKTLHSLLLSK